MTPTSVKLLIHDRIHDIEIIFTPKGRGAVRKGKRRKDSPKLLHAGCESRVFQQDVLDVSIVPLANSHWPMAT